MTPFFTSQRLSLNKVSSVEKDQKKEKVLEHYERKEKSLFYIEIQDFTIMKKHNKLKKNITIYK